MAGPSSVQLLSPNTLPRGDKLVLTWPLNLETYNPALSVFYHLSSPHILNVLEERHIAPHRATLSRDI